MDQHRSKVTNRGQLTNNVYFFSVRAAAKMEGSNKISLCILLLAFILLLCSTGLLMYVCENKVRQ